nr:hypothetical protein [Psychrosphaera haliotis]
MQNKTKVENGVIESFWFENSHIGLPKTRFHRLILPLTAFDSGLDYDEQPTKTEIVLDWYKLVLIDPSVLDGLNLNHATYPEAEGSVYIGCSHNWCDVKELKISKNQNGSYTVAGEIDIEFENEGVGKNETFTFQTYCEYFET